MRGRRWSSNRGPLVQELEQRSMAWLGVEHCVCVCNATVGLGIAIRGAGRHGQVLVPFYTFIATAHAFQSQEVTLMFADMESRTHNFDPAQIERWVRPRRTGIIGCARGAGAGAQHSSSLPRADRRLQKAERGH